MADYGSLAWPIYNQTLKVMLEQAEKQLEEIKQNIQAVNLARKSEQTVAGSKLFNLERR